MAGYNSVILGGGMVAGYAAKALVARGMAAGELAIVSADDAPPYERPPLSKGFLAGTEAEESVFINADAFYHAHGIALQLDTVVESVDVANQRLHARTGGDIEYRKLLIATGARVRTLDVPGAALDRILYLRSLDDSKRIRAACDGARRAVVIGSGFIGMEVAAVLAQRGIQTAMLFPGERVWQRFFTPEMSAFFQRYYEERGVTFVTGATVASFEGDGRVTAMVTSQGQRLPADLVVAGIGVTPVTEVLSGTGLRLENGVVVNEYLETNVPNVYAAGDVANYRDVIFERQRRVEHWDNAVEQGKHAAGLLLGERRPFVHVPYFFSDVFDLSYELWGDPEGAERAVSRGDITSSRFSVWWLRGKTLVAAFVMNRPDEEREAAPRWIAERRQMSADALADNSRPLESATA